MGANVSDLSFDQFQAVSLTYEQNKELNDKDLYKILNKQLLDHHSNPSSKISSAVHSLRKAISAHFSSKRLSIFPGPPPGGVITVNGSTSLIKVAKLLGSHNILSAPVINSDAERLSPWSDKYLGMVDMVGLSMFVLDKLYQVSTLSPSLLDELPEHEIFSTTTVSSIVKREVTGGPFVPIHISSSLLDAILVLGKYRMHRINVIKGAEVMNIVTQSAVVRFLAEEVEAVDQGNGNLALKAMMDMPLTELGLALPKHVWSVHASAPAVDAFRLIKEHGVTAVAVVSAEGVLIGNISVRDIRTFVSKHAFWRGMPAQEYLQEVARVAAEDGHTTPNRTPIACRPHDPLRTVLEKVNANKVHRVYVVDEGFRPTSVVSLGDLLSAMVQTPEEDYFNDVLEKSSA